MVTKGFIAIYLNLLVISVHGRPEAGLPYFYQPPPVNEKTPNAAQKTTINQAYIPAGFSSKEQAYNNVPPGASYGTPILQSPNLQQTTVAESSRNYIGPEVSYINRAPTGAYRSQPEQSLSIQKHIYFHVAPPDVEEENAQIATQQVARQKHYKIIFVKVPSYPSPSQYIAQQQAPPEEKTLIYVLVKKPEDSLPMKIVSQPITKPEVYFIKYKARREQVEPTGVQNLNQQSESAHFDNDDSVVIEAAGRGASNIGKGYTYNRPVGILK